MAATRTTPGRRRHNNQKENVFFEPGKQGRRTGITLKDTGIRDEFGLEPVSGIFSSPVVSPNKDYHNQPDNDDNKGNTTLPSSDMVLAESPPPDITDTLNLRKTPRLPPKTATPRHTNIGGSPVRHSAVRPDHPRSPLPPLSAQPDRANRKLDFSRNTNPVSPSPFKPRPGKSRKSIFNFDDSPARPADAARANSADLEQTVQDAQDAVDQVLAGTHDLSHPLPPPEDDRDPSQLDQSEDEIVTVQLNDIPKSQVTNSLAAVLASGQSSNQKRKREQVRANDQLVQDSPSRSYPQSAQKRRKSRAAPDATIVDAADITRIDQTMLDTTEYTTADQTEYTTADQTEYTMADHTEYTTADRTEYTTADPTEYTVADQTQYTVADHTQHTPADHTGYTAADPTEYTLADPTEYTLQSIEQSHMPDDTEAGADATTISATVEAAPMDEVSDEEQDHPDDISEPEEYLPPPEADHDEQAEQPQKRGKGRPKGRKSASKQAVQRKPTQARATVDRDTQSVDPDGTKRRGPKSLVALRAGTPQDDEGATQTRSGRTSIKPLKYWCNESFIWKHGEVDGVVRAEELSNPKPLSRARAKPKKKASALGAIREDEEDEDEDLLPEAWEEELGVINSNVRTWDAETGMGNPEDEIHEDIAYASSSIVPRAAQDLSFKYAKIMNLPFFGAGLVEVPPEGYKRMKNSRRMQMVFFVHEGKVTVEVGDVRFGMSKGGVWQVPRGNNYAILNESKRHTAKVFFAQGCEVEGGVEEGGPSA